MYKYLYSTGLFIFAALVGTGIGLSDPASVSVANADEYSSGSSSFGSSEPASSSSSFDSSSSIASSESSSESSVSSPFCGNWVTEGDEECDDGPDGSEGCNTICAAEYRCWCECGDANGGRICADERVPSTQCLNHLAKAKSQTECTNNNGKTCSGHEPNNVNNKLSGTLKSCTWKKISSGSSGGIGQSSSSSSEDSSSSN